MKDVLVTANSEANTVDIQNEFANMLRAATQGESQSSVHVSQIQSHGQGELPNTLSQRTNADTQLTVMNSEALQYGQHSVEESFLNFHEETEATPHMSSMSTVHDNMTQGQNSDNARSAITRMTNSEAENTFLRGTGLRINNRLLEGLSYFCEYVIQFAVNEF